MFTKSYWVCPLLCVALAQPSNEEKAAKDLVRMQGAWTLQALEINGKDVSNTQLQETFLAIKKDEYHTKIKGKEIFGFRIKLDASKDPKTIDMIKAVQGGADEVYKGIYTFENDTMKICRGLTATQDRPNQFATWPDTSYFVVTWKKQAK